MSEVLLTRSELIAERELSAAEIERLKTLLAQLLQQLERVRTDKATIERWYANAIKEVMRLRDQLDVALSE